MRFYSAKHFYIRAYPFLYFNTYLTVCRHIYLPSLRYKPTSTWLILYMYIYSLHRRQCAPAIPASTCCCCLVAHYISGAHMYKTANVHTYIRLLFITLCFHFYGVAFNACVASYMPFCFIFSPFFIILFFSLLILYSVFFDYLFSTRLPFSAASCFWQSFKYASCLGIRLDHLWPLIIENLLMFVFLFSFFFAS